jgi:hypothetical protein
LDRRFRPMRRRFRGRILLFTDSRACLMSMKHLWSLNCAILLRLESKNLRL